MRLMSKQSTNQWRQKTCLTNILLAYLVATEALAYAVAAAATITKQHRGFAKQLQIKPEVNWDDSSASNLYHQPHFTGNRSVIVQLFEWKFLDIADECRTFLGPHGYAGVQLSPVLEHTLIKTSTLNHPWWERYEVISYRFASRSGDESEFWSMSRICNDNGVRIYADVILNHMAAPLHILDSTITNKDFIVDTLLEEHVNISLLNYPNVSYTQKDFHRPCDIGNAQDAHKIRNCQLNGHPDLDLAQTAVQKQIVEMLNKFIDMGVAGFRIDTAKHIWPIDLKKLYEQVNDLNEEFNFNKNTRPLFYHDVFDMGLDSVSKTEYSTYGVVSEYLYPAELAAILNGKAPLTSLINWGPAMGFLANQDSLVFIDSPDTQRGLPIALGRNYMVTHKQRIKYIMANAFMLAHPYGNIKRIMSSYYYAEKDINQGPPVEEDDENVIRSPQFNEQQQCTIDSGWVCEHRWLPLVKMVEVANYFRVPGQKEKSIIHFQSNGPNQIAFCRGYKLFMAMNNDRVMDFAKEIYTCMKPGIYCDMITGGKQDDEQSCHGRVLEVNEEGYAHLTLPVADANTGGGNEIEGEKGEKPQKMESYGILVVYVGSKLSPKEDSLKTEENFETIEAADSETNAQAQDDVEIVEVNESETEENNGTPLPDTPNEEDVENENHNAEDNEIENPDDPEIEENGVPTKTKSEEDDEIIDQSETGNENNTETLAESETEEQADVNKDVAEEMESPEPETSETEDHLEGNEEETDNNPEEETNADTPGDGHPTDEEVEKPSSKEMQENPEETNIQANEELPNEAENSVEIDEEENLSQTQPETSKESSKEIETLEETDVPQTESETAKESSKEIETLEENDLAQAESETPEESSKEIENLEENDAPEQNEPENIDEIEQKPEEQLEKPSADIVDVITRENDKAQDIMQAGFIGKSQKDGRTNG